MLKHPQKVRELESSYDRERYASMSIEERKARYASLRSMAVTTSTSPGSDWRKDIEADLLVAKILNDQGADD